MESPLKLLLLSHLLDELMTYISQITPCVNTKMFGERSFSHAGPSVWNNLPQTLHHSDSASSFKAAHV